MGSGSPTRPLFALGSEPGASGATQVWERGEVWKLTFPTPPATPHHHHHNIIYLFFIFLLFPSFSLLFLRNFLQALVEYFGGELKILPNPVHGKPGTIIVEEGSFTFKGMPEQFTAAR